MAIYLELKVRKVVINKNRTIISYRIFKTEGPFKKVDPVDGKMYEYYNRTPLRADSIIYKGTKPQFNIVGDDFRAVMNEVNTGNNLNILSVDYRVSINAI